MIVKDIEPKKEEKVYICKIDVEHRGCWGPELTKKYKSLSMTFFCVVNPYENVLNSIVRLNSDSPKNVQDVIEHMISSENILDIRKIGVIEGGRKTIKNNNLLFFIKSEKPEIMPLIEKYDLIPIPPVRVSHGIEEWILIVNNKKNLNKFYNNLKNRANTKIKEFKDFSLDFNLDLDFDPTSSSLITNKQKEVLRLFYKEGYYDWPRKVTVKEVTEKANLCRSTVQEHLRKAESKIMSSFIEKFLK